MRFYKLLILFFTIVVISACNNNKSENNNSKTNKEKTIDTIAVYRNCMDIANKWLQYVDNRKHIESYSLSSSMFKKSGSIDDWEIAINSFETAYGKIKKRKLLEIKLDTILPNAPKGKYVIIKFITESEKVPIFRERVVLVRDADSNWNITGYFPE